MISVQSIVSDAAQAAHQNESRKRYFAQAVDVFTSQFPVFAKTLSETQQHEFIAFAYERSKTLGFRMDQDHLRCLVAIVFLGGFFDTDYQFYDDLYFAGWQDKNGHRPSLKRLCHQIDRFAADTRNDLTSNKRIMLSLVNLYQDETTSVSIANIVSSCRATWPERASRIRDEIWSYWVQVCVADAQALGLDGSDVRLHCVLSLYFGHKFHRDPLFPWAVAAYAQLPAIDPPGLDAWRIALLDGVRHYFEDRTTAAARRA